MGTFAKVSDGLELRETSMRLVFTWQGKQVKETPRDDDGRFKRPSNQNIKFAKGQLALINTKIRAGNFVFEEFFPFSKRDRIKNVAGTFGECIERWYSQLDLKKSTLTTYRRYKDGVRKPALGERMIKSIRKSDVTTWLASGTWSSGKTRNNVLSIENGVFQLAVGDGLIEKNPCATIEQAKWQRKKCDPFDLEEAEAIIAPAQASNFFEFQFYSGLRTSEAIGLPWSAIDFNKNTALISQGFVVDELEESTKTATQRSVRLNSLAMAALKRQKDWTFLAGDRVFHDPVTNKPWAYEQNARKRYWTPTLKSLGIRYRRPYNTRHTYATVRLMSGTNPAFMAKQMGHDLKMFFEVYADWIDGTANDAEMLKIEEKISRNKPLLNHISQGDVVSP